MKREYFIFTVGYKGNYAIIDNEYLKKYSKFSTKQLFEAGLLKQSYLSSLFENDIQAFINLYNEKTNNNYDLSTIQKWFGIESVPPINKFLFI